MTEEELKATLEGNYQILPPSAGAKGEATFWAVAETYAGSIVAWFPSEEEARQFARSQEERDQRQYYTETILKALADSYEIPLADLEAGSELIARTMLARIRAAHREKTAAQLR